MVAEVHEMMVGRANEAGVQLTFLPAAEVPLLLFDPQGIQRACLNVIGNAIDACEGNEAGLVSVVVSHDSRAKRLNVQVADNGPGIPADELQAVFTLFHSEKGSRGTGLGLPVSQKILREHGGDVLLESEAGNGCRFTLHWPAVLAGPEETVEIPIN